MKLLEDLSIQELKATAWDMATAIENIQVRLGAVRNELAKRSDAEQGAMEPVANEPVAAS